MANFSCENCKTILTVTVSAGVDMLVSRFPDDLPTAYLQLAAGPSALLCPVCGHITHFTTVRLVCGRNDRAILYMPDEARTPTPSGEADLLGAIARWRQPLGMDGMDITRDRRSFRRAFLQVFVIPSADLANDYSFSAGPPMEWVQRHEADLDALFFSAQWLLASGVVPSFQSSPSGGRPASSFVPHEEAHSDANHIVKRRLTAG